jgi:hypothetical protein
MLLSTAPVDAELGVKLHRRMTVGLDASRALPGDRTRTADRDLPRVHQTEACFGGQRNGSTLSRRSRNISE